MTGEATDRNDRRVVVGVRANHALGHAKGLEGVIRPCPEAP